LPLFIATAPSARHALVVIGWWNAPKNTGAQMEQSQVRVTTRQVLADLAFTAMAAFATGGTVGGIAFVVVRWFA
jgi:hypothetical protein